MAFQLLSAALAVGLLAGAAGAHEFRLGALTIGHPYAVETVPTARTAAGYLSVANAGPEADRLLAVEAAGFPETELHVTETDAAGVSRMRHVEGLEIPAGATLALEPRGAHVMFMGPEAPLKDGDRIPATLTFERAGTIEVMFNVEPRTAAAPADHSGH